MDNQEEDDVEPETTRRSSDTPRSTSESEIFAISSSKNVFRPAFLTIKNLDFPEEPSTEVKQISKKRLRYKAIPKDCSTHLHRMFVKSEYNSIEEMSRTSSRASTDYDEYQFEEYLRDFNSREDPSECSLFFAEDDDSLSKQPRTVIDIESLEEPPTPKIEVIQSPQPEEKVSESVNQHHNTHKREKRKSLTLSRIPSPETVQVIRIDVISGYLIESDNSIISGFTDHTERPESVDSTAMSCIKSGKTHDHGTQTLPIENEEKAVGNRRSSKSFECRHLLHCKSLNLTDRWINGGNSHRS